MADSYTFTSEDKHVRGEEVRKLGLMPEISARLIPVDVFDALDQPNAYDICIGKDWALALSPAQTISALKRYRNQYMREVNRLQQEIDRLSLLELEFTDPRVDIPWPRYYELRAKEQSK